MKQHSAAPKIGVFDSGFGGLTVLKALLEVLPDAQYLYFGDTARLPYGSKSAQTVAKYACEAARFLEDRGAELLVIACNTATALALDQIRLASSVKVVGVIEPGAQQASAASRSRKVIVIGTEATVCSHAYQRALTALEVESREKACPLLVPLVEEGWVDHPVTEQVAKIYLDEAFSDGFQSADVLLLGCTHYPLLKKVLHSAVPKDVALVDSAESTAVAVRNLVNFGNQHADAADLSGKVKALGRGSSSDAELKFFVTDSVDKFRRLGKAFLGQEIKDITHIDIE